MKNLVELLPDWRDVTGEIAGEDVPFTLAKPDGVGALQITVAFYQAGSVPAPNTAALLSLLHDFGETRGLGDPSDICTESAPIGLAAATFLADVFIRAWYLSDGHNFALATYTCARDNAANELPECERMVRTVCFE